MKTPQELAKEPYKRQVSDPLYLEGLLEHFDRTMNHPKRRKSDKKEVAWTTINQKA